MSERYVFPLRYDDSEMKRAVNAFIVRALFRESAAHTLVPLALIGLSIVMLGLSGEDQIASLLLALAIFVLGVWVSGGWRRLQREMREKLNAARGKFCFARLYDEGLVIEAGGPAPMLEWKSVKAIWPVGSTLLLVLATNHFVALPVAGAPKEALDYLRAQVAG